MAWIEPSFMRRDTGVERNNDRPRFPTLQKGALHLRERKFHTHWHVALLKSALSLGFMRLNDGSVYTIPQVEA